MITVYAYVVADLIHVGHVYALENAKQLGDKLIVGVLTDDAVMEKKKKPIIPFEERIKLISSLKCVNCVVAQSTYSPIENIKTIKPNILMESNSHTDNDLISTYEVTSKLNIRIIKMPYFEGQSSTDIKNKIKNGK